MICFDRRWFDLPFVIMLSKDYLKEIQIVFIFLKGLYLDCYLRKWICSSTVWVYVHATEIYTVASSQNIPWAFFYEIILTKLMETCYLSSFQHTFYQCEAP